MLTKIVIVLMLFIIIFVLFRGLYFLVKGKGNPEQTVKSLTWRISLSVVLIILLIIAVLSGYVEPHGVNPNVQT